jgi:hypothetical protein
MELRRQGDFDFGAPFTFASVASTLATGVSSAFQTLMNFSCTASTFSLNRSSSAVSTATFSAPFSGKNPIAEGAVTSFIS